MINKRRYSNKFKQLKKYKITHVMVSNYAHQKALKSVGENAKVVIILHSSKRIGEFS